MRFFIGVCHETDARICTVLLRNGNACDDRHSQPFLWVCAHDFMYARRLLPVLL
jgi:hypothetical protein